MSELDVLLQVEDNWPYDVYIPGTGTLDGWAGSWAKYNRRFGDGITQLNSIVEWILENIENPKSNAHWTRVGDYIHVAIRRPKDYQWFLMRWQ